MELTGGLNDRRRECNGNTQVFEAATAGETGGWRGWGGRESAGGVKVSVAMLCWRCR